MPNELRTELGVPNGSDVIITPNLTKTNSKLLSQAWKLKDRGYKFIRANNKGQVMARKDIGDEVQRIRNTNDILAIDEGALTDEFGYILC